MIFQKSQPPLNKGGSQYSEISQDEIKATVKKEYLKQVRAVLKSNSMSKILFKLLMHGLCLQYGQGQLLFSAEKWS